jgi:hypothetical protein
MLRIAPHLPFLPEFVPNFAGCADVERKGPISEAPTSIPGPIDYGSYIQASIHIIT